MRLAPGPRVVSGSSFDHLRPIERMASAAVVIVAATSAFEVASPRLAVRGLQVSTLEATTALALIGGLASLAFGPQGSRRLAFLAPALTCVGIACLSAAFAPAYAGEAWRTCGRLLAAWLLVASVAHVVRTRAQARVLVGVLLAVGAVTGVVALLELRQVPWVMRALTAFRPGFHVVGGQVRASATFVYPTVASMFLEVVFGLGLWFVVDPPASASRLRRLLPLAALTLVAAGIVASFTRAGLLGMFASLAVVAGLRYQRTRGVDASIRRLAALSAIVVLLIAGSRSPEAWASRVSTDTSQDWYGADYTVPATLTLPPGRMTGVPITIENEGLLTWQSQDDPIFAMSYHWLAPGSDLLVDFEGARTPFAQPVGPGGRVQMLVGVRAPQRPGDYTLVWDVVHEGRAWLSTEGVFAPRTAVRVEGVAPATPLETHGTLPRASLRMPRRQLWRAAARMTADHPWLGVGAGNFRQHYGAYLGLGAWDRRVHANNLYLEVLTGTGVPGLLALLWLMSVVAGAAWRAWTQFHDGSCGAALVATGVVIAGHGLVDAFLAFTSTYVVFALAAGLAAAAAEHGFGHAHRV